MDRLQRAIVRCLILVGVVFFWLAVISLLTSCKTSKQVTGKIDADIAVEQEIATNVNVATGVSIIEQATTTENKNCDVTITILSIPDSTGKQYPTKVIDIKANTNRVTEAVKNEDRHTDSTAQEVTTTTEEVVVKGEKKEVTETDVGWRFSLWWLLIIPVFLLIIWCRK